MHKEGCKLKWNPPEDDGGEPVSHYAIEKQDQETGRWVPVGRTDKPEMTVQNLEPGHEYKFRVKAVNNEGESDPLDTELGVVAKNPFGKFVVLISSSRGSDPVDVDGGESFFQMNRDRLERPKLWIGIRITST